MAKKTKKKKSTIPPHMKRTVHVGRIILDLKSLRGAFKRVNKKIAPNKDKGIYFEKAMYDLEKNIKKYERIRDKSK